MLQVDGAPVCWVKKFVKMKEILEMRSNTKICRNMRFLTRWFANNYEPKINSIVVPMLYPYKEKSPYIIDIQAFINANCELERSRTPNLLIRSQTLYPIELRVLFVFIFHKIVNNIQLIQPLIKSNL